MGVSQDGDLGVALDRLLDVLRARIEGDAELLQDRPPLRRARREYQAQTALPAQASPSSGKKISISRAAELGESEPWTRLNVISVAKSPRIEPGAASSGFVAPIT